MWLRRRRAAAPDALALVSTAYQQRLAALERLRVARAGVVAARARADNESLADTDAVLDAAVTLVQQQLDVLRRQRARLMSAADTAAALAGVQADLEALAVEFEPVLETLTNEASK